MESTSVPEFSSPAKENQDFRKSFSSSFRASVKTVENDNLMNYLKNRDKFIVTQEHHDKNSFEIAMKSTSFNKIISLLGITFEEGSQFILILLINTQITTHLNTQSITKTTKTIQTQEIQTSFHKFVVDDSEKYEKILDYSKYFYFIDSKFANEGIPQNQVPISKKSTQKIVSMTGKEWKSLISFVIFKIITVEYETQVSKVLVTQYKYIFKTIPLFEVVFTEESKRVGVSSFSFQKIISLLGQKTLGSINYMNFKIVNDAKEKVWFLNEGYKRLTLNATALSLKEFEHDSLINIKSDASPSTALSKISVQEKPEIYREKTSNLIDELEKKFKAKKNQLEASVNNKNNIIVITTDKDGNQVKLQKVLYDAIIDDKSEFDDCCTKDVDGKEICVKKSTLSSTTPDEVIEVNNIGLMDILDIKKIINEYSFYNQTCQLQEDDTKYFIREITIKEIGDIDIKSSITFPQAKEKQSQIIESLKNSLSQDNKVNLIQLNNESNYIPSSIVEKIKSISSEPEKKFTVDNSYDGKRIKFSLNDIKYPDKIFVEVKSKDSPDEKFICEKEELINKIDEIKDLNNPIQIKDKSFLLEKIIVSEFTQTEIPAQVSDQNKAIESNLSEENSLVKYKDTFIYYVICKRIMSSTNKLKVYHLKDINGNEVIVHTDDLNINNRYVVIKNNETGEEEKIKYDDVERSVKDDDNEKIIGKDATENEIQLNKMNSKVLIQNTLTPDEIEKIIKDQPEVKKNNLITAVTEYYYPLYDNEKNLHIIREKRLKQVIDHTQKVPFVNYLIYLDNGDAIQTTKADCEEALRQSSDISKTYIKCYDSTKSPEKTFFITKKTIQEFDQGLEGKISTVPNVDVSLKNVELAPESILDSLPAQPEEEKNEKLNSTVQENKEKLKEENSLIKYGENYLTFKLCKRIIDDNDGINIYHIKDINNNQLVIKKDELDLSKKFINVKSKITKEEKKVPFQDIEEILHSDKNDDISVNGLDGTQLILNKSNFEVLELSKEINDSEIEEMIKNQPEKKKKEILSSVREYYYPLDGNFVREEKLNQVTKYVPKVQFTKYLIISENGNKIITTKSQCEDALKLSKDPSKSYIKCFNKSSPTSATFFVSKKVIEDFDKGLDDEVSTEPNSKIALKNIEVSPLSKVDALPPQPEEEKNYIIKILNEKINSLTPSQKYVELNDINNLNVFLLVKYLDEISKDQDQKKSLEVSQIPIKYKIKDIDKKEIVVDSAVAKVNSKDEEILYLLVLNKKTNEYFLIKNEEIKQKLKEGLNEDDFYLIKLFDQKRKAEIEIELNDIEIEVPKEEVQIEGILPEVIQKIEEVEEPKNIILEHPNKEILHEIQPKIEPRFYGPMVGTNIEGSDTTLEVKNTFEEELKEEPKEAPPKPKKPSKKPQKKLQENPQEKPQEKKKYTIRAVVIKKVKVKK